MAEHEAMTYRREAQVGSIALNRPQSLNAVNDLFEEDIAAALLEFDLDETAWVAIVRGAGRCFCAGADIKQLFVEMTPRQSALRSRGTSAEGDMARTINWKPVSAAELHRLGLINRLVPAAMGNEPLRTPECISSR